MSIEFNTIKLSPKSIYEEISKTVMGQEAAKTSMSELLFIHFLRHVNASKTGLPLTKKSNGLLMGPTGTGKTFVVREGCAAIRRITGLNVFNMLEVDCTSLTARGWQGDDLVTLLVDFRKKVAKDGGNTDTNIVFLDEFDKLCRSAIGSGGSDHNRNTQYSLLKAIEGTVLHAEESQRRGATSIDTSPLLFIMAGNFFQVRENRKKSSSTIGFKTVEHVDQEFDMHQELENAGMASQLVGRTTHVAELNYLSEQDLSDILIKQVIPEYTELWNIADQDLSVSEEKKERIVAGAFKRKTGARGLHADFAKEMQDQMFNLEFKI